MTLIEKLEKHAKFRRAIKKGKKDELADALEEAIRELTRRGQPWYQRMWMK